ncbi:MAG: hypothetical protein R6U04_11040 [Bacteroidales bacterium]
MKQSKYILVILLLWATGTFAQQGSGSFLELHRRMKDKEMRKYSSSYLDKAEGTPYLSEEYLASKVYFKGQTKPVAADLRYNMHSDNFEFIRSGTRFIISPQIDSIKYSEHSFVHKTYIKEKWGLFGSSTDTMEGFLAWLVKGPCSLYKIYSVEFRDAKAPESGYDDYKPPRFERKNPTYCIQLKDDPHPRVVHSFGIKKFLDNFESSEKELKEYIKGNNLRLKEEDDLIKFIRYYNQHYGNK